MSVLLKMKPSKIHCVKYGCLPPEMVTDNCPSQVPKQVLSDVEFII